MPGLWTIPPHSTGQSSISTSPLTTNQLIIISQSRPSFQTENLQENAHHIFCSQYYPSLDTILTGGKETFQQQYHLEQTKPFHSASIGQTLCPMHHTKSSMIQVIRFQNKNHNHNPFCAAKYSPNPDWLSFRPWGYKFRKARCVIWTYQSLDRYYYVICVDIII